MAADNNFLGNQNERILAEVANLRDQVRVLLDQLATDLSNVKARLSAIEVAVDHLHVTVAQEKTRIDRLRPRKRSS
jgi:hypothetical protein